LELLGFVAGETPNQPREPTTNSTHHPGESNPGRTGERRALSPLQRLYVHYTLLSTPFKTKARSSYAEFSGERETKQWIFPRVLRIERLSTWAQI